MRIVYATPFYYPIIGGVEKVAQRVAEYTALHGHDVYVITYNRSRNVRKFYLPRKEIINGVEVIRVKPDFVWSHGTYSSEVPKVLEEIRPDLVHVHDWRHPHVFQVAKYKKKLKFKAILHPHSPFHNRAQLELTTWLYHKAIDCLRKGVLSQYDSLIALTPHEKNILVGKLCVEEEKIAIIPNGIDDELPKLAEKKANTNFMVLYLGRISKSKNVEILVKSMKSVKTKDVKLVIAGPDENLATKLKNYSKKHFINFHYLGEVTTSEKCKLYNQCTVFAHPAIYEPFGITLLEAQAFGNPCVITGNGGQLYVAPPGITSLHANPNPKDFGEKIAKLLTEQELYKELSSNARNWALQHLWSKILPEYKKLYDQVCA